MLHVVCCPPVKDTSIAVGPLFVPTSGWLSSVDFLFRSTIRIKVNHGGYCNPCFFIQLLYAVTVGNVITNNDGKIDATLYSYVGRKLTNK